MTTSGKSTTKSKSTAAKTKKAAMQADAKAKVAKLAAMEAEHKKSQRGYRNLFIASLFLNLMFIVAIYAILEYQNH